MDFPRCSSRKAFRRQPSRFGLVARRGLKWVGIWIVVASTPLLALNPERRPDGYSLRGWFTEDGLPSNKVRDIVQTRDGYLWLATGQGLARFDGVKFTPFNAATHPALQGNDFYAVLEAPDGTLWAGGESGLFRWRDGQFTRFTKADGLPHNYVRSLGLMRDGTVVAGTRRGYSFVRDGKITRTGGAWKQVSGVARAFLERADGTLLLATTTGLWRVAGESVERLSGAGAGQVPGTAFFSLLETADRTVWIGYSGGVQCLRPDGSTEQFGEAHGITSSRGSALCADRDGNLWIAASGRLYRFAQGKLAPANYAESFKGTPLQQLREDREGGLWIATVTGLFRLKDNVAESIGPEQGLLDTFVQSAYETPDGSAWLGLWYGGVYRFDGIAAARVPGLASLDVSRVYGFAAGQDGALWIAAETGLHRYAHGALENFFHAENEKAWKKQIADGTRTIFPGIAHNWVAAVAVDGGGSVWAATEGALYQGVGGNFRAWTTADGLPAGSFEAVVATRDGDVWATVPPLGVVRRHEGKWITYLCGREISARAPIAIFADDSGDVWITTRGGGLNRFHHGRWSAFTTRDGLVDDFISGIAEDKLGYFWIAFPRGVMRVARAEFDEIEAGTRARLQPRIFNHSDGLPRGEINSVGRPNVQRMHDGRLLFATDLGLAVIDPKHVRMNPLKPPVCIERVIVNGTAADLAQPIVVPPGRKLQINYTALSLLAPEKVRFKTRLDPLDRDWIETDEAREVRYGQLPAGRYTFRVRACNNDGVWNDEESTIAFRVRPYFYQTGWFVGLGLLSVAGASFGIIHLRARLARRRMTMLENVVRLRTRELIWKTALLEAQLDSSPDGVLVTDPRGERILQNQHFAELWRIPPEVAEDPDTNRQVRFVREQVKNNREFVEKVLHLHAHPEETSRDEIELKDGTFLDRCSAPVRGRDGTHYGRIWTVRDITAQRRAQQQLVAASRHAGMAEIATGVLHNIGNVLNSVNVSATLVGDTVRESHALGLSRVGALLREQAGDWPAFFTRDPRGARLPAYLVSLSEHVETERAGILREIEGLRKNIEHIKDIVAMQQTYARGGGITEKTAVTELIEDALRITDASLVRGGVRLVRDFRAGSEITVEKHKVVQILVNLLRNATHACNEAGRADKEITVGVVATDHGLEIAVVDNGAGIAPENLTRIFAHGFTTRKDGHGFGLHSGAIAARELGGALSVRSDGPGRGATFFLKLPLKPDPAVT